MDEKLLEEIEINFIPSKKDCEVDQKIEKIILNGLKELSKYFPEETWEVIHHCELRVILDNVDGLAFPIPKQKENLILLFYNANKPKKPDELVKVLLHELAHVYFKHKERGSPIIESRQEKETENLTNKWFNAYYLARNDPLRPRGTFFNLPKK